MSKAWCMVQSRIRKASVQCNQVLSRFHVRMMTISLAACGWESVAEMSRTSDVAGPLQLMLPQLALFTIIGLHFFPAVGVRYRKHINVMLILLLPVAVVALFHSCFRMGVSLCCCCRSFCPVTHPAEFEPDTAACVLVVSNCYMAFIRKVAHFYGMSSSIQIHTSILVDRLVSTDRQLSAYSSCLSFLAKTRVQ